MVISRVQRMGRKGKAKTAKCELLKCTRIVVRCYHPLLPNMVMEESNEI